MCGIAGLLVESAASTGIERGELLEAALRRMTTALKYRGPDGEGHFRDRGLGQTLYLGHRRLDVFAPGPVGAQPMSDPSGRLTVAFNGAIYNFVELASELGVTGEARRSDTAVLLAAWATWGPACLGRLNGMFAFAMWDAAERTLYLCRDRFGEKPLHFAVGDGGGVRLLFASEVKALFAAQLVRPRVDRAQLAEFVATHNIDHRIGATFFSGIEQVPAGCYLRIGPQDRPGSQLRPLRYFSLAPPARQRSLDADLVAETRALLDDAVAIRLRSDVAIGGSLSGGLDSSLLTALVAGRPVPARQYRIFSCQFPHASEPGDETAWAAQVIRHLGRTGLERVQPTAADFAADLETVLFHQEAPFADASICAHFALMRAVRTAGVKVLLSGQGGDEVFAGYGSYYYVLLGALLGSGQPAQLGHHAARRARLTGEPLARVLAGAAYHALPAHLQQHLYKRRRDGGYPLSPAGRALLDAAPARFGGPLPSICRLPESAWSRFDVYLIDCMARWALPHILRHDDRNSMAFGIESRAPYLDHRLTELLLQVSPVARIGDGYTKLLLREVATGLLPEPVRLRVDKRGFFSPQGDWLRACEGQVRAACGELPAELAELTDGRRLATLVDRFYREQPGSPANGLGAIIWSAFVTSLFLGRVLPRFEHAGI